MSGVHRKQRARLIRILENDSEPHLPESELRALLLACFPRSSDCPNLTITTVSLVDLRSRLGQLLRRRAHRPVCIAFDLWHASELVRDCDAVCEALHKRLVSLTDIGDMDLVLLVREISVLTNALYFKDRLLPSCKSAGVGLLVIELGKHVRTRQFVSPHLARAPRPPARRAIEAAIKPSLAPIDAEKFVAAHSDVLFGHFEVCDAPVHVPALLSLGRIRQDPDARDTLVQLLTAAIPAELSQDMLLRTFDMNSGVIESLALGMAGNDDRRLLTESSDARSIRGRPIVILADMLCSVHPITQTVQRYQSAGPSAIMLMGLSRYRSFTAPPGTEILWCPTTLPYDEYGIEDAACPFCRQGSTPVQLAYIDTSTEALGAFDSVTFWELIGSVPASFEVGHWVSPVTGHHYLHRIQVRPLLQTHAYGISVRLANRIRYDARIKPSWIDCIVCPADSAGEELARALAPRIGLRDQHVVALPRSLFSKATATDEPPALTKFIDDHYASQLHQHANVLIVDQAAHRLGTLAPLKHICKLRGGKVLAFVVLINRLSGNELYAGEWLWDTEFISLYEWKCAPFRNDMCPCRRLEDA